MRFKHSQQELEELELFEPDYDNGIAKLLRKMIIGAIFLTN